MMEDKPFDPNKEFEEKEKKLKEQEHQQPQQYAQSATLETEDVNKWEMDTNPWIDRWYHEMIGEVELAGAWVPDDNLTPTMNERGAHTLAMMIYSRGNIHTQMSEFTIDDIRFMAADAGEDTAELLRDNWREWKMKPSKSLMNAVANMVFHMIYSLLLISLKGGMRRHREKRGIKTMMPQMPSYPEPML